ncbi:MAG: isoprenylcysteine carboxylmethyltransferase family protein [Ruminococcus sp.]|nr:isoprenylcysteine carboxylmethyltransferase family protein [Ruminococcus sp.]
MIWMISALLVLIAFYSIYLGKMLVQRRKGIQTDQIARGEKRGPLYYTELLMKIATYAVVAAELVSIVRNSSMLGSWAKFLGLALGIAGVAVFGLAVWTMRDSWRAGIPESDETEMVTEGLYKYSRNPAFLGFDLVYLGVLLMFFNPVQLLFAVWAGVMLHLQILQEERFLKTRFGEKYAAYCKRTGRYFGRKG